MRTLAIMIPEHVLREDQIRTCHNDSPKINQTEEDSSIMNEY